MKITTHTSSNIIRMIGLESEYILEQRGKIYSAKELANRTGVPIPYDGCGFLVEIRGKPGRDRFETFGNFMAERKRVWDFIRLANNKIGFESSIFMSSYTNIKLSNKQRMQMSRESEKSGQYEERNVYGYTKHKKYNLYAGMHVHFSIERVKSTVTSYGIDEAFGKYISSEECEKEYALWDFLQLVKDMDEMYRDIIDLHDRNRGFYEMKPYGVEYRSLPTICIIEEISTLCNNVWEKFDNVKLV